MTARTSLRSETRGPGQQQLDAPDAFLTLWARLQSPSPLRFSSLREGRRRTRCHVVFLTILRFAIHHEWRSSILLRQQQQFHQLCFLDFSRTQLFWNFCLLDLAGALVNQFSLLRRTYEREFHTRMDGSVCCLHSRFSPCFCQILDSETVQIHHLESVQIHDSENLPVCCNKLSRFSVI